MSVIGGKQGTRVLFSFRAPTERSNPYVELLIRSIRGQTKVQFFSWRRALFGRYDVLHVHWPETMIRGRTTTRRIIRIAGMLLLLSRIQVQGIGLVRTLHNVSPHEEGSAVERWALKTLDRLTSVWVVMNVDDSVAALSLPQDAVVSIPHGHFKEWYTEQPGTERQPGHILLFGQLRPYKGIEELLEAFSEVPTRPGSSVTLSICGMPSDDQFGERIRQITESDPRVDARLRFLSEDELVEAIQSADVVVLPYRRMLNSGAVLTALSLNRRVLVPRSDLNDRLAKEVGTDWVLMFEWPLTARDLATVVELPSPSGEPDLSDRGWTLIGERHALAYARAAREPRVTHRR